MPANAPHRRPGGAGPPLYRCAVCGPFEPHPDGDAMATAEQIGRATPWQARKAAKAVHRWLEQAGFKNLDIIKLMQLKNLDMLDSPASI